MFYPFGIFSDQREVRKQQSAIFKWERDKFILYQSLYTLGAQAWEHFTIGSNVSLYLSRSSFDINSTEWYKPVTGDTYFLSYSGGATG